MNATISKLPDENGKGSYRLWVDWKDYSFCITLFKDKEAWIGNASSSYVEELSQSVHLTIENYINETKTALSSYGAASHFTYNIENNRFIWKKMDPSSQIKIQYGSVPLLTVPFHETVERMLDALLDQNSCLQTEVANLQKINVVTSKERIVLVEQLVEYKKQKLKMEQELLSQFLVVLNTKKEHIQQLEAQISGNKMTPPPSTSACDIKSTTSPDHYDSDTEVEDTDDEGKPRNCALDDDNLFDDVETSVSILPKLASRPKRTLGGTVIGPSARKFKKPLLDDGVNTDDLLDEF